MRKILFFTAFVLCFIGIIFFACQRVSDDLLAPSKIDREGVSSLSKSGVTICTSVSKNYGNIDLNQWQSSHQNEIWDLTCCDLTISYTIDMSGQATGGWTPIEVGLRDLGYPDLDPNNHGGWMWSSWQYPSTNPNSADLDDHFLLVNHGWSSNETHYDVDETGTIVTPFGIYNSYAFWFDRDGVDQWQATYWNYKDGITYNTGGIYNVVIHYHAMNPTTATMMATINGEDQGFYLTGYTSTNPPSEQPVGKSFNADMTKMQVFHGRGGGGGIVKILNLIVEGCLFTIEVEIDIKPGSNPNSINLKSNGVVPVAVLTTSDFNIIDIDPSTVQFAGASPLRWAKEDVDNDGDVDMVFHFKVRELTLNQNSVEATLNGNTLTGIPFEGTDTVNIVPK